MRPELSPFSFFLPSAMFFFAQFTVVFLVPHALSLSLSFGHLHSNYYHTVLHITTYHYTPLLPRRLRLACSLHYLVLALYLPSSYVFQRSLLLLSVVLLSVLSVTHASNRWYSICPSVRVIHTHRPLSSAVIFRCASPLLSIPISQMRSRSVSVESASYKKETEREKIKDGRTV